MHTNDAKIDPPKFSDDIQPCVSAHSICRLLFIKSVEGQTVEAARLKRVLKNSQQNCQHLLADFLHRAGRATFTPHLLLF